MCSCGEEAPAEEAPPPPPPVPGSLEWMEEPENAIVAPGPEQAAAGSNLAMTESGNIAVNLNDYLRYKAQREQVGCAPNALSAGSHPVLSSLPRCNFLRTGEVVDVELSLAQTAAKMEKILLSELQKAQPCEIEMGEDGVARCKAGTGVGSRSLFVCRGQALVSAVAFLVFCVEGGLRWAACGAASDAAFTLSAAGMMIAP